MSVWHDLVVDFHGAPVYAKRRAGVGVPVVFLHGFGDYGDCWQGLLQRLPTEINATLVDSMGHGHTGFPADGCDSVARRDSVIALLRDHIGPAVLVGHSMGAATALAVAAHAPELVRGIVLEDPPWWAAAIDERGRDALRISRGESIVQWIDGLQTQSVADITADSRAAHPNWDEIEFEHWARSKTRVNLAGVDLPFRDIPESLREQWRALACPSLLMTGNPVHGAIVTDEVAHQFLETAQLSSRSHHATVGHDTRRDDPRGVSQAIATFISSISPVA
jgi:pimeloyl-ACP methyl ester carboxylesterase